MDNNIPPTPPGDPWATELALLDQHIAEMQSYRNALTSDIEARNRAINHMQTFLVRINRELK